MKFTKLFADAGYKVKFINKEEGKVKSSPLGFSWTTFFFGFLAPLFRGDWLGAIGMLCVWSTAIIIVGPIVAAVVQIVMAVFYNYVYVSQLLSKRYEVYNENDKILVKKHGYK